MKALGTILTLLLLLAITFVSMKIGHFVDYVIWSGAALGVVVLIIGIFWGTVKEKFKTKKGK